MQYCDMLIVMPAPDLAFVHRFVPGDDALGPVLLLLHGTGGSEDDMVPIARVLWPGAAVLSPRGQVLEQGMPRFFRRLAVGVFDLDDLRLRTNLLADFVSAAAERYRFPQARVVAAGYSNGANIAASVLLLRPDAFRHAMVWRAQVPLEPERRPNLGEHHVLITGGRQDPIVPAEETQRLGDLLSACGADVQLQWFDQGHTLSHEDLQVSRNWLRRQFVAAR
jgi:predicted esterase